ncbi:MAG: hypothetical protein FJ292_09995 [Planctomycetes bacterium]|nr:hypothetical protein [Planctomycetota bacterium]
MRFAWRALWSPGRTAAWCTLALLACTIVVRAEAPESLRKIVVIGASVSDGFGVRLRTAQQDGRSVVVGVDMRTLLQAAAREPDMRVTSHATSMYFSDPARFARESVRQALEDRPSLVLAVDWLFWNAYGIGGTRGPMPKNCDDRMALLERGLSELEPLVRSGVPMVLGDLPDMQSAIGGGMISQAMVPDPECLARLNTRIRSWCADRPTVMLVDLYDLVRRVLDGKPVRACNRDWCETDLGPLLQRDRLHPTLNGTMAVVAAALEAADRGTGGAASKAFDLDPSTIRARIGTVAAQGATAKDAVNAAEVPTVRRTSEDPRVQPAAAGSGSNPSP